MRIEKWKDKEVLDAVLKNADINANAVMDDVVAKSKLLCPVDTETYREGKFQEAHVKFTRKTGRVPQEKGTVAEFDAKRWMGRFPGQLRDTIRKVEKIDLKKARRFKLRVYAGNFKVYYAMFVERGTVKMKAIPFLRPSFESEKPNMINRIKNGV